MTTLTAVSLRQSVVMYQKCHVIDFNLSIFQQNGWDLGDAVL